MSKTNFPADITEILLKAKDEQIKQMNKQLEMMARLQEEIMELKQQRLKSEMAKGQYQPHQFVRFDLDRATTSLQDQRMTAFCFDPLPQWPDELDDPSKSYKYRLQSTSSSSRNRSEGDRERRGERRNSRDRERSRDGEKDRRRDSIERDRRSRSERDRQESRRRSRSRERERTRERSRSGSYDRNGQWLPYWERTERQGSRERKEKSPPRRIEEKTKRDSDSRRESSRKREPSPKRRNEASPKRVSRDHHSSQSKAESSSSSSRHQESEKVKDSKSSSSSSRPREPTSSKSVKPSSSSSRDPKPSSSKDEKSRSSKDKPSSSGSKTTSSRSKETTKSSSSSSKPSTSKSSSSQSKPSKDREKKEKETVNIPIFAQIIEALEQEKERQAEMEEVVEYGWDDTVEEVDCLEVVEVLSPSPEPDDGLSAYERLQQRAAAIPGFDASSGSEDNDDDEDDEPSQPALRARVPEEENGADVVFLQQIRPQQPMMGPSTTTFGQPPMMASNQSPADKDFLAKIQGTAPPPSDGILPVPAPFASSAKPKQVPNPPGTGKRARKKAARQAALVAASAADAATPVLPVPVPVSANITLTKKSKLSKQQRKQQRKALYQSASSATFIAAAGGRGCLTVAKKKPANVPIEFRPIPTVIDLTLKHVQKAEKKKASPSKKSAPANIPSLLSMNSTGWRPPPLVGPPPTAGPSHPFYSAPQSFQPPQHPFYAPPQPQFPPQPYFQPPQPTPQFNSYPPQPMMMDPAYSMQPPANNVYPTQPPVVDLSLDQSALEAEAFLNSLNNFDKNVDSRGTRRKSRSRSKSPAKTQPSSSFPPAEEKATQHYYYTIFDKSGVPVPRIGKRTTDKPAVKKRKVNEQIDDGDDFDMMFK